MPTTTKALTEETKMPAPEPLWSRRAKAQQAKNHGFFREARAVDGRESPAAWKSSVLPNTTQSQHAKEPRLAGTKDLPRTRKRLIGGNRVMVGVDRTTGVTADDRAAAKATNSQFFDAAKEQAAIERARRR